VRARGNLTRPILTRRRMEASYSVKIQHFYYVLRQKPRFAARAAGINDLIKSY
jgi:hypothetical protein